MNASVGFDAEIAQPGQNISQAGLLRFSATPAGTLRRNAAISFRANWQSQLAGLALNAGSDESETARRIRLDSAQPNAPSQGLDPEIAQHAALSLELVPGNSTRSTQPQQVPNQALSVETSGNLQNTVTSAIAGKDMRRLEVKHTSAASTAAVSFGMVSRTQFLHARESKIAAPFGQAIEDLLASLQTVQATAMNSIRAGLQKQPQNDSSSGSPLSVTGSTGQLVQVASMNPPPPASSDGDSMRSGSNLKPLENFSPGDAASQPTQIASSESHTRPLANSGSLHPVNDRTLGMPNSARITAAYTSTPPPSFEQGSLPSQNPSHQEISPTDLFPLSRNANTAAESHRGPGEINTISHQSLHLGMGANPNGSEPATSEAADSKSVVHASARIADPKSNTEKPPVQGSKVDPTHTSATATIANVTHVSLEGTDNAPSTGPEMVTGAAPAQKLSDFQAHTIDLHRAPAGHTTTETFNALDSGTGIPSASLGGASSRRAEAGFQDSSLGWVGIRAELSGGAVHATVSGSSLDAAQALRGHMAGLGVYLAENRTPVETLTLATAGGNSHGGFGASQQEGNRESGQQDHPGSGDPGSASGPLTPEVRHGPVPVLDAIEHVATSGTTGGTYISVIV